MIVKGSLIQAAAKAGYEAMIAAYLACGNHNIKPSAHRWEDQSEQVKEDWRVIVRAILEVLKTDAGPR